MPTACVAINIIDVVSQNYDGGWVVAKFEKLHRGCFAFKNKAGHMILQSEF